MTNLEIDRKLAEAMGFTVLQGQKVMNQIQIVDDSGEKRSFAPVISMEDAWEVAERFGFRSLRLSGITEKYNVFLENQQATYTAYAEDKSAPLAICKAALKVIEGSKSDE
jgi:hypothetical protein